MIVDETGAQSLIGFTIDAGQPDKQGRCLLEITDKHLNRHGVLHGGIISCLLDTAAGVTGSLTVDEKGKEPFLSITLTVNYLSPAYPGKVEAIGKITGGGRKLLFIDAILQDEDGKPLATSSGVYKRVARSMS